MSSLRQEVKKLDRLVRTSSVDMTLRVRLLEKVQVLLTQIERLEETNAL